MRTAITLAGCVLVFASGAGAQPAPAPLGDATRGQVLFMRDGCYECHGTVGQGGMAGPRIAAPAFPFVVVNAYIRHPAGQMPPYGTQVVSDGEVRDIQAYLASVPAPPPVSSLPAFGGTSPNP